MPDDAKPKFPPVYGYMTDDEHATAAFCRVILDMGFMLERTLMENPSRPILQAAVDAVEAAAMHEFDKVFAAAKERVPHVS